MTQFDLIALAMLAVSGVIGFSRGAIRELSTVVAFLAAVVLALLASRLSGPIVRHWLHPAWAANIIALAAVFVLAYIAVRALAARIARSVHGVQALGGLDRVLGLGIGLVRGFVILGVFQLVFTVATPQGRMPHWISGAALYPAAIDSARVLAGLEPEGLALVGKLAPALKQAVTEDGDPKTGDKGDSSMEKAH